MSGGGGTIHMLSPLQNREANVYGVHVCAVMWLPTHFILQQEYWVLWLELVVAGTCARVRLVTSFCVHIFTSECAV
jgi:hypothetical protein